MYSRAGKPSAFHNAPTFKIPDNKSSLLAWIKAESTWQSLPKCVLWQPNTPARASKITSSTTTTALVFQGVYWKFIVPPQKRKLPILSTSCQFFLSIFAVSSSELDKHVEKKRARNEPQWKQSILWAIAWTSAKITITFTDNHLQTTKNTEQTFWKPMSLDVSLKHWRQRFKPYFLMRPWRLPQRRLHIPARTTVSFQSSTGTHHVISTYQDRQPGPYFRGWLNQTVWWPIAKGSRTPKEDGRQREGHLCACATLSKMTAMLPRSRYIVSMTATN